MHEFGIAESVLGAVEKRAAGRGVSHVRVQAGALLRITEPALEQAFSMVAGGTVAEGAKIDLIVLPVRLDCRSCGGSAESTDALAACPGCGGLDIDMHGGEELLLESIQLTEEEHVPGDSRRGRGDPA
ncbi:hydrogenase maturation nickel metallochaperone HypA [Nonomuraea sp. NPDC046570]|uniref:hydrogenase maturation nickel metallochaperone HypA/HybF n=1 Tax=Nonomuraea sp. NPDC046570 TaxID=3155255 RepID=UPI0033F60D30